MKVAAGFPDDGVNALKSESGNLAKPVEARFGTPAHFCQSESLQPLHFNLHLFDLRGQIAFLLLQFQIAGHLNGLHGRKLNRDRICERRSSQPAQAVQNQLPVVLDIGRLPPGLDVVLPEILLQGNQFRFILCG